MKHKTRKKIAAFIAAVILLAAAALIIVGLSSYARADEKPWRAIVADPSKQNSNKAYIEGTVANFTASTTGAVRVEFTSGRVYLTGWANVLMYKD